jgi:flagellin
MAVNFFTNTAALNAQRNLETTGNAYDKSLQRLSSGNQITSPSDNPSGLALSGLLQGDIGSNQQAQRNVADASSLLQVSEGGLAEINNLLVRMRELAITASSDVVRDDERDYLNIEYQSLRDEITRIADTTNFRGNRLLNGQGRNYTFQVGTGNTESDRVTYQGMGINVRADALGVDDIDLSSSDSAQDSLQTIDNAIYQIQTPRAQTGAFQARLESINRSLQTNEDILTANVSRIRDTDFAREATELAKHGIQRQAGVALLSQANFSPELALKLIESK